MIMSTYHDFTKDVTLRRFLGKDNNKATHTYQS
jgi:hypothetical protein